jgi:hypothetical protein
LIFVVGLLLESEKVGLATAEELNRQKEQLKATESRYIQFRGLPSPPKFIILK